MEGIMSIIQRSAYLALCTECGRHGHVVCTDGTTSDEFATRSGGLKELRALVLSGKIAKDESLAVSNQIEDGLTLEDPRINEFFEKLQEMKKGIHSLLDGFHRELEEYFAQQTEGEKAGMSDKRTLH